MMREKEYFRKKCKERLTKSSKISKLYKDKMIEKNLLKIIKNINIRNILLYIPFGFEPDITRMTKKLRKKYRIYVPFMEGVSFKIVKYRLPLLEKKFSIKEPPNSFINIKRVDLAIVPVLGVGRNYGRIGFGKGMYDRYFEDLDCRPIIVFVQIEKCFDKKVNTDTYDIRSDFYVTPEKIYITRGNRYVDRDFGGGCKFDRRRSGRCRNPKKIGVVKI